MAMKRAFVTLELVFDDTRNASPESWDWQAMLDLEGDNQLAEVTEYEEEDA